MKTLEFWPQQPHHLLVVSDDVTIGAGGTFEATEEDALELLTAPGTEIREPQQDRPSPRPSSPDAEPGRAERASTPTT